MHTPSNVAALSTATASVYFVDASLPDLQTLLAGLPAGAKVHFLPTQSDGLKFMANALLGCHGIKALHLMCHSAPGRLYLGSVAVGIDSLPRYARELYAIKDAMAENGRWLIYGYEVEQGAEGRWFVEGLRMVAEMQVAVVTHKVGATELGGSWGLNDVADMAR